MLTSLLHRRVPALLALLPSLLLAATEPAPVTAKVVVPAAVPTKTAAARLTLFSPQGEMRAVRQVQARFSEDMVRFGDPRVSNPFTIRCAAPGKGRWVDTKNWAYDFSEDLPAGLACEFTLVKGLKSVAGKPVVTYPLYRFNTGGPLVVDSLPRAGISYSTEDQLFLVKRNSRLELAVQPADRGVAEAQVFMLKLDGVVDRRSVTANAYCLAQGIKEKIPLRLLNAAEENAHLATLKWWEQEWWSSQRSGSFQELSRPVRSRLMVTCQRRLPNEARVTVVWGRDIAADSGLRNRQEQLLGYQVRPEFTATFSCDRESARKPCSPLGSMRLNFTEAISAAALQNVALISGDKTWMPAPNDEGDGYEASDSLRFRGPFPANASFTLRLPDRTIPLGNDSARALKNAERFPLSVKTGDYPPLAKFSADFGIVERAVGAIPLTLRNLEPSQPGAASKTAAKLFVLRLPDDDKALIAWLKKESLVANKPWGLPAEEIENPDQPGQKITRPAPPDPRADAFIRDQPGVQEMALPKQLPAREFEVVGIPVAKPGVYLHEVESRYLGESLLAQDKPMYVHSMSLVTNLAVHFKRGKVNSLVWVTTLDKAEPVADAQVEVHDCHAGELLWSGRTDKDGVARLNAALPEVERNAWIEEDGQAALAKSGSCRGSSMLVSARKDDDRGFVLSGWNEGIQPWRYQINNYYSDADVFSAHTVFDRNLLRPGETVHMRHFLRARSQSGFSAPRLRPEKVFLVHEGSNQEYELSPVFDAGGNADSQWTVPPAAKLGNYSVVFRDKEQSWFSGSFKVAEFRLPMLKARLQLPAGPQVWSESIPADATLEYLNGGAFPEAVVTLRGRVDEDFAFFPDYDEFSFRTCVSSEGEDLCPPFSDFEASEALEEQTASLDAHGANRFDVPLSERVNPARVSLEMEFRDPSGETQTVAANTRYWPAEWLPGIKVASWAKTGSRVPVDVVVLDTRGQRVKKAPVRVDVFLNETISHRSKTVGGFYAYTTESALKPLSVHCQGKTDASGRLHCDLPVQASGELRLRAVVTDKAGREATSSASAWISGEESWWFSQENTDRIDLIPEKKEYRPGDTMRLQLRMPFPQATVLVTTEREGIFDAFVQTLSAKSPVLTVPVRGDYAPNIFVSALAVRGRDDSVQATALVDLGKPAFKMGLTSVKVGWDDFRLDVKVSSDRPRYRIREKARMHVQVRAPSGQSLPPGTEVMIAAVDEALLELSANPSWDVLKAMMGERGHRVDTATSQLQVVGKRHYGRKALPAGGGGGQGGQGRELFDTLLFWTARTTVAADGSADFTIPLNDSLSGFRLVAVASAEQRFGFGQASIKTFQDLQVISGLPALLREGDHFDAGFTVRNAASKPQQIDFSARSEALKADFKTHLVLAPGQSQLLEFPVIVPAGLDRADWQISAKSGAASDSLKVSQKILDPVPERVLQATLTQLEPGIPYVLPLRRPQDALPGGGVDLLLRPHLADSLDGLKRYFRDYRYSCLEQQLSRAIALDDKAAFASIQQNLPSYLDDNGLLKLFTPLAFGDPLITAYVLEVVHESGWSLPPAVRDRMLEALQKFVTGKLNPQVWNFGGFDNDARRLKALSVLARYGRFDKSMLGNLNVQPGLWPTAMVLDWLSLLQADHGIPDYQGRMNEAAMILRARLNLQGTALMLSRNESNQWWLYSSPDAVAVRLFLLAQTLPGWQDDLPRLLRGITLRQSGGHWDTTLANAWGVLALRRFSERFESAPVVGKTAVNLAGQTRDVVWEPTATPSLRMAWPAADAALSVSHQGSGKPWMTVRSVARIPLTQPWSTGYAVSREVLPLQQKVAGEWHVGDVAMVVLTVDAQTDMGWVVMEDPVPAGASLLGRGLDRDSGLLQDEEWQHMVWWRYWSPPDFAEYKQEAWRGYYARVGKGPLTVSYIVRLNQSGDFQMPPTRVEAMYAPEMFGMSPNANWTVKP